MYAVGSCILLLVFSVLMGLLVGLLVGLLAPSVKIQAELLQLMLFPLPVLVVVVLAKKTQKIHWNQLVHLKQVPARYYMPISLTFFGLLGLLSLLDFYLIENDPTTAYFDQMVKEATSQGWLSILMVGVLAPLGEELLFRGLLFRGLLIRYGFFTAALASSLLFGAVHFNPSQVLSAFFVGFLLCKIYDRFRSFFLCFLIHAIINCLAIWSTQTSIEIEGLTKAPETPFPPGLTALYALLFLLGYWLTFRNNQDTP